MIEAHPLTVLILIGTLMIAPLWLLATWTFSGADPRRGWALALGYAVIGAVLATLVVSETLPQLGPFGNAVVPVLWATAITLTVVYRQWLLERPLSQHWLISLQGFRCIGGVFLIESAEGRLPASFAIPAGYGDLVVGTLAIAVLFAYRRAAHIPAGWIRAIIVLGVIDFAVALFFGFASAPAPWQLFAFGERNDTLRFPVGLIPVVLVPLALAFHVLSWLQLSRDRPQTLA